MMASKSKYTISLSFGFSYEVNDYILRKKCSFKLLMFTAGLNCFVVSDCQKTSCLSVLSIERFGNIATGINMYLDFTIIKRPWLLFKCICYICFFIEENVIKLFYFVI